MDDIPPGGLSYPAPCQPTRNAPSAGGPHDVRHQAVVAVGVSHEKSDRREERWHVHRRCPGALRRRKNATRCVGREGDASDDVKP